MARNHWTAFKGTKEIQELETPNILSLEDFEGFAYLYRSSELAELFEEEAQGGITNKEIMPGIRLESISFFSPESGSGGMGEAVFSSDTPFKDGDVISFTLSGSQQIYCFILEEIEGSLYAALVIGGTEAAGNFIVTNSTRSHISRLPFTGDLYMRVGQHNEYRGVSLMLGFGEPLAGSGVLYGAGGHGFYWYNFNETSRGLFITSTDLTMLREMAELLGMGFSAFISINRGEFMPLPINEYGGVDKDSPLFNPVINELSKLRAGNRAFIELRAAVTNDINQVVWPELGPAPEIDTGDDGG